MVPVELTDLGEAQEHRPLCARLRDNTEGLLEEGCVRRIVLEC